MLFPHYFDIVKHRPSGFRNGNQKTKELRLKTYAKIILNFILNFSLEGNADTCAEHGRSRQWVLRYVNTSKNILLLGLLLFTIVACKNEQESHQVLRGITYDQMQQGVIENKIKVPANIPYYSIDGSLVTDNFGNANLSNPIATTWFVDSENSIVKVQILNAEDGQEQLRSKPLINDLKTMDCGNLKSILGRFNHRMTMLNGNENLNKLLEQQNTEALEFLLKKCGFPNVQNAGQEGVQTAWTVLQNAPVETRRLYFSQVVEASKNGDLERQDVALMQDKMLMDYGKPQLYGSQVLRDDTGNFTLYNLDKPAQVDARRAIMGMTPLKEYLEHFNIVYDVTQTTN